MVSSISPIHSGFVESQPYPASSSPIHAPKHRHPRASRVATRSPSASMAVIATAMEAEGDLVATRLARGCRCFGAWIGDELAGYGWLSTKPEWIGEIELTITPSEDEGYIWNCFTLEQFRRRGVLRALLAGIRERAHAEGLSRLWIGSVAIPAERERLVRPASPLPWFSPAN